MSLYYLLKSKVNKFVEKTKDELIKRAFELQKQSTLELITKSNLPENVLEQFVKSTINPKFYLQIAYNQQQFNKKIGYQFAYFLEKVVK